MDNPGSRLGREKTLEPSIAAQMRHFNRWIQSKTSRVGSECDSHGPSLMPTIHALCRHAQALRTTISANIATLKPSTPPSGGAQCRLRRDCGAMS